MVAIMQALATPCSALPTDASALASSISACRSSIAALESSLKTTEGSSGGWETFAWICSVAVAVGVAAEIVGIVGEYRDDLKDWQRGIVRPPDCPSFARFFWFEILATVIVVGGVFGEAWASKELASINNQLRMKTSELRADSDQLLAWAIQEAGNADERAAANEKQAAKAELELARLKAPRSLTEAEKRELIKELKPFAGTPVTILFEFSDGEVKALMDQLWDVFNKAGWKVGFGSAEQFKTSPAATLGVDIAEYGDLKMGGVSMPHHFEKASIALSASLKKLGLLTKYPGIKLVSGDPDEKVLMVIGKKPFQ
jgi:hypothetical protein